MVLFCNLLDCFKKHDRLKVHDVDDWKDRSVERKSEQLQKGLDQLNNQVFRPSLWSFHWIFKGNAQTLMSLVKDDFIAWKNGPMIYDKREIFTFEDGGKIAIDFMGELFQTRDHL